MNIMNICVFLLLSVAALAGASDDSSGQNCPEQEFGDVYFIIDASGSLNTAGYSKQLNFVNACIEAFPIGPNNVRIGLSNFSSDFKPIFDFDTSYDKAELSRRLYSSIKSSWVSRLDIAYDKVLAEGYLKGHKLPFVLVTISDYGLDFPTEALNAINKIRAETNAITLSLTIGVVNQTTAETLAGSPSRVKSIKDNGAVNFVRSFLKKVRVCPETPAPTTVTPVTEPPTTAQQDCTEQEVGDIYIIQDASNSINAVGYSREQSFVNAIIQNVTLGPNNVRIGLGNFSNDFKSVFEFDTSFDQQELSRRVNNSLKGTGVSLLDIAYEKVLGDGHLTGHRNPLIVVTLSDFKLDKRQESLDGIQRIRDLTNAQTLSLTIGTYDQATAEAIAGGSGNVISVKDQGAVNFVKSRLGRVRVCTGTEPPTTTTTEPPTTTTTEPPTTTTTEPPTTTTTEPPTTTTTEPPTTTTTEPPTTTTTEPPTTTTTEPQIAPSIATPAPCRSKLAIAICMDSSGSMTKAEFDTIRSSVTKIIVSLSLSSGRVQIAVSTFSSGNYPGGAHLTRDPIEAFKALASTSYHGGTTNTHKCINWATDLLDREADSDASKIIITYTDGGASVPTLLFLAAIQAKRDGCIIIPVGIGSNVDKTELAQIGTDNKYLLAKNFNALPALLNDILNSLCKATLSVRIG